MKRIWMVMLGLCCACQVLADAVIALLVAQYKVDRSGGVFCQPDRRQ